MNSIIPIMMIIFGFLWRNNPPKSVNWIYGYRTSMSMKNDETWKFAHKHQVKIWRKLGIISLLASTIVMVLFKNNYETASSWIIYLEMFILIFSMIPTEIALRRKFDREGNLKNEDR